jgi:hypothetical protein
LGAGTAQVSRINNPALTAGEGKREAGNGAVGDKNLEADDVFDFRNQS